MSTALTNDCVIARATCEVVSGLRTNNQVVAHATVSGKAYCRVYSRVRFIGKERRRIDDVMSVEIKRISECEYPLVIFIFSIRQFGERIERFVTKFHP